MLKTLTLAAFFAAFVGGAIMASTGSAAAAGARATTGWEMFDGVDGESTDFPHKDW